MKLNEILFLGTLNPRLCLVTTRNPSPSGCDITTATLCLELVDV